MKGHELANKLFAATKKMRAAQKAYFKQRNSYLLMQAKEAEIEVDTILRLIDNYQEQKKQAQLPLL